MHKVHMHDGAISKLLYGLRLYGRKPTRYLKLVDYLTVQTHEPYNSRDINVLDTCITDNWGYEISQTPGAMRGPYPLPHPHPTISPGNLYITFFKKNMLFGRLDYLHMSEKLPKNTDDMESI